MSDINEIVLNGNAYSLEPQDIGDINDLTTTDKSSIVAAINEVNGRFFGGSLFPMATEHYRLNGNGMCSADQTAYLRKYSVTSGTLLYIKASKDFNGVFQWQSAAGVPDTGATNPKLVGDPVNDAYDGFITVPSGALFLYVCSSVDNTTNIVAYEVNTFTKIRQNFVVGSPQIYTGSILENNNIHSLTTTDIYSIYDTLVSEHPEVITRATDIGNGSDGSPIRHYIVRMQNPVLNPARDSATLDINTWISSYDYRSIVINAGTHGDEKASVYGVAMFIKELVESSDDWALFIKGNFILHIIPVLNIYGFNNTNRNNSNSKDINRTFLDASTEEAAALTTFIQSDPKIEIVIDSHNDPYPVGYIGFYIQNDWALPLLQMSAKIAGATKPFLTTLYNDATKSPYMLAMIQPHTYGVALDGWAGMNGYIPCVIEAPRSLGGGYINYGKGGNITKLLLGNIIQTLGCMQ